MFRQASRPLAHRAAARTQLTQLRHASSFRNSKPGRFVAGTVAVGTAALLLAYYYDSESIAHEHLIMPAMRKLLTPEEGHQFAVKLLSLPSWARPGDMGVDGPELRADVFGLPVQNPVGVAAGFDKDAQCIDGLFDIGFGYVEVGSVTPLPQPGNDKPRFFRLEDDDAAINRYGFNSLGHGQALTQLRARVHRFAKEHRDLFPNPDAANLVPPRGVPRSLKKDHVLGVNLGKNKASAADSDDDYVKGVQLLGPYADVLVVNVSSPNTPGLRALQSRNSLTRLLSAVVKERDTIAVDGLPKVAVKVTCDLSEDELADVAAAVRSAGVDGVIISNTTVRRDLGLKSENAGETGGLSGKPLLPYALNGVRQLRPLLPPSIPIIGCGGVFTGQDALDFAHAGASMVQLYTSFGYRGVGTPRLIKNEITSLLESPNGLAVTSSWRDQVGLGYAARHLPWDESRVAAEAAAIRNEAHSLGRSLQDAERAQSAKERELAARRRVLDGAADVKGAAQQYGQQAHDAVRAGTERAQAHARQLGRDAEASVEDAKRDAARWGREVDANVRDISQQAHDGVRRAADQAQRAGDAAQDKLHATLSSAERAARSWGRQAEAGAEEASRDAARWGRHVDASVRDAAEQAHGAARETADEAQRLGAQAQDALHGTLSAAERELRDGLAEAERAARQWRADAEAGVQETKRDAARWGREVDANLRDIGEQAEAGLRDAAAQAGRAGAQAQDALHGTLNAAERELRDGLAEAEARAAQWGAQLKGSAERAEAEAADWAAQFRRDAAHKAADAQRTLHARLNDAERAGRETAASVQDTVHGTLRGAEQRAADGLEHAQSRAEAFAKAAGSRISDNVDHAERQAAQAKSRAEQFAQAAGSRLGDRVDAAGDAAASAAETARAAAADAASSAQSAVQSGLAQAQDAAQTVSDRAAQYAAQARDGAAQAAQTAQSYAAQAARDAQAAAAQAQQAAHDGWEQAQAKADALARQGKDAVADAAEQLQAAGKAANDEIRATVTDLEQDADTLKRHTFLDAASRPATGGLGSAVAAQAARNAAAAATDKNQWEKDVKEGEKRWV